MGRTNWLRTDLSRLPRFRGIAHCGLGVGYCLVALPSTTPPRRLQGPLLYDIAVFRPLLERTRSPLTLSRPGSSHCVVYPQRGYTRESGNVAIRFCKWILQAGLAVCACLLIHANVIEAQNSHPQTNGDRHQGCPVT